MPVEDCLLECDSRTTAENAALSFKVFQNYKNHSFANEEKILVVTDTYHVWRTQLHFEKFFQEPSSKTRFIIETISSSTDWLKLYYQIRELGAIAKNLLLFRVDSSAWWRLFSELVFPLFTFSRQI
eukprot:TRINITY_DN6565_c0_g1_i1.p1 TRINITY_DN6565_c0_g1~~TRINITY_DN6565_c0_g1_i1.p1  ORF type:complete len:126 (+),score=8.93 TRINITY_DN6565_c0_g1_i1:578-955(+)